MDRNKPGSSRSGKSKPGVPHHGSELFALGSKSSARDDTKISKVVMSSSKPTDRKRDASTTLTSAVVKKPKITSIGSTSRLSDGPSSSSAIEYWEQVATDCEIVDLIPSVLSAIEQQNSDTVIALVCGAIRSLVMSRSKPDNMLFLTLTYMAKIRPQLFCNDVVTTALLSILKRETGHAFKGRTNPTLHILAANLLARGYHNKTQWPITFVQIYMDDAINDRVWVDHDDCSSFIENVCTAFGTKVPPKAMLQSEPSNRDINMDDDSGEASSAAETIRSASDINIDCPVQPRYLHLTVEKLVLDAVKDLLNRRQAPDSSVRNLLRFLSATSGISEIRALASYGGRLEHWMHNGKLQKPAQELLTYICYNVTISDTEVLANLVKMRLKTKPLINIYMNCLKEMITVQPSILFIVLKTVVQNELSSVRNPNNMGMLACMFQAKPEEAAQHLAEIYQELLMQREDCLRTLRVFLRELVKMLRFDIKLTVFCNKLLTMNKSLISQCDTLDYRDRIFYSMVDLECLCMFLSVSPQIKEAIVSMRAGRDNRGSKVLYEFYEQMSILQHDALQWMCNVVPMVFKFKPTDGEYSQALHKILFLDAPDAYSKVDQWPPEQERSLLIRLVSEIPLHEDSIMYIIRIGVTKEIPFKVPDTVEMLEQVIRRAAGLKITDFPPLQASKLKIIEYLFIMAEYHHPGDIALPVGYEPPKLAISLLYWKAWNMLLMLSAHNPSTFGAFCWEQYPMLRNLMEMCITNQFTDSKVPEDELQMNALERTHILEFETHLAAATSKLIITDQTSLLLSQLMLMDPFGCARRPPNHILEQLQQQNASLKLGHLLCRSRKPDLLLDIIQRQGSSQSMPWLADLVQNSEGDFNDLPVQCLCEFLLSNSSNISTENSRDVELLTYLQKLLSDESGDHQTSCEVLEYFLRRLSSTCKQSRQMAIKGLRLLLKVFQKEVDGVDHSEYVESDWLLRFLPMMPFFPSVRLIVIIQLRAACQIENNPDLVMIYIQFIAANTLHDSVPDMLEHVMDMSQLIVERSTIFSCIIPPSDDCTDEERLQTLNCLFVMFNNYLIKLREHKAPLALSEYPDLLTVNFADGTTLPIHLNIIQAFVILLTYSTMIPNPQAILDYWFPIDVPPPQAFTLDTSEPVQILPDWLKLKMIRSSVERLVDAALLDLAPDTIILFVQNFGTPVNSMSKLLALLDRAVIEQFDAVKSAIMNKTYLSQLIEIQQARGAKNGHIAVQALELHGQVVVDPPKRDVIVVDPLTVNMAVVDANPMISATKEIEEIVDVVLSNQIMTKSHRMRFRRLMQQLIAEDVPNQTMSSMSQPQHTRSIVVQYLMRLSTGPNADYLRKQNLQRSSVCSLFRTLLTLPPGKQEALNFLTQVIDQLRDNVADVGLNPVILQIFLNKRKVVMKSTEHPSQMDKEDLIQVLDTSNMMELEKRGKKVLSNLLKETDSSYMVNAITVALKTSEKVKIEGSQSDKIGLLVDWLADIDSELVVANTTKQMDLLFSRSLRQFRFYMLSLLSHQASWTTLHKTLNNILQTFNRNYDPTSVLHFIGAFIRNPKLWQGRDKATPKHEQVENVIDLNSNQIRVFADYILSESVFDPEKLTYRVEVLLKCVHRNDFNLNNLISYVRNSDVDAVVQRKFLQQLYLNFPPMKFIVADLNEVYKADAKNLSGCQADITTNYVLTTISSLSATKDFQLSSDMELMVRKLAASHPSLILRQLSVLSSLLQGRAHMDLSVLRMGHHMTLFHQVLGILELLQPQVFEEPYTDVLHQALECYFTLLQYHADSIPMPLMYRFMELLQAYTNKDANKALNFIEPHAELIQYLSTKNRNIISLQQIVQGVSLLKHRHTHDFSYVDRSEDISEDVKPSTSTVEPNTIPTISQQEQDSAGAAAVILVPYEKQNLAPQHWPQLVKAILHRNGDEILGALQEVEIITSKRQGLLEPLFERILELLESPNAIIRNTAHTLLVRHLKFNPGIPANNSKALVAYIQCLRVSDPAVVTSALETLTEIVICLQEYASDILKIVFDLGTQSRLNTFDELRRCIVALKTQHAC